MRRALFFLRLGLLVLGATSPGCSFYGPTFADCTIRCDEKGACPTSLTCLSGYCRRADATGSCDCKAGDQRPCGGGKGECTPGVETCSSEGTWSGLCVGEPKPTRELCDGKDNDCNGLVDDDASDLMACALTEGVCKDSKRRCVGGQQAPCTPADYKPGYEPIEYSCDGLDNDCDGLTDVTAEAPVATGVQRWSFDTADGGFAVTMTRATDAGEELVVARLTPLMAPIGAPVVLRVGPPVQLATGTLGSDLYVAWVGGALEAVRIDAFGVAHRFATVPDAGFASALSLGVSGQLTAAYLAQGAGGLDGGSQIPRVVQWALDGGLLRTVDLKPATDPWPMDDIYVCNVSREGNVVVVQGLLPDAGTDHFADVVELASLAYLGHDVFYFGENSSVLHELPDGGLTSFYSWIRTPGEACSDVYLNPNLLDPARYEINVSGGPSGSTACGPSDITVSPTLNADMIYMDVVFKAMVQARAVAGGHTLVQPIKSLPKAIGYGVPRLAQPAAGELLGLVLESSGTLNGLRVCGQR